MSETHMLPPLGDLAVDWGRDIPTQETRPRFPSSASEIEAHKKLHIRLLGVQAPVPALAGVTPAAEAGCVCSSGSLRQAFSLVCPQQGPPGS